MIRSHYGALIGIAFMVSIVGSVLETRAVMAQTPECAASVTTEIGAEIEAAMGFPILHNDEIDPQQRATVCHERFCAEFNGETRSPVWVVERLTKGIVTGKNKRPKVAWKHDPELPETIPTVSDNEYKKSDFSRGHLAASSDFKCHKQWMKQTFIFSNAVPQIQNGFNGAIWRSLEGHIQNLANQRQEVFVITGPVPMRSDGADIVVPAQRNACGNDITLAGLSKLKKAEICDENDDDPTQQCGAGIAVPSGLFKIIYVPETERRFAFLMSNEDHKPFRKASQSTTQYLEQWRVSIDVIEDLTSLEFFPNVPTRDNDVGRLHCTQTRWR